MEVRGGYSCEEENAVWADHEVKLVCAEEVDLDPHGVDRRWEKEADAQLYSEEYTGLEHYERWICGVVNDLGSWDWLVVGGIHDI